MPLEKGFKDVGCEVCAIIREEGYRKAISGEDSVEPLDDHFGACVACEEILNETGVMIHQGYYETLRSGSPTVWSMNVNCNSGPRG